MIEFLCQTIFESNQQEKYKKIIEILENIEDEEIKIEKSYLLFKIYQNGGAGARKDEAKAKKYFRVLEVAMTELLIYISLSEENKTLGDITRTSCDNIKKGVSIYPNDHPVKEIYNKLNLKLEEKEFEKLYYKIVKKIKVYLENDQEYFRMEDIYCDEKVREIAMIIVCFCKEEEATERSEENKKTKREDRREDKREIDEEYNERK